MKVNELVELYQKNKMIDLKKILEIKEYISIAYKQKIAELVLDECITEQNGNLYINSLSRYILFTMAVISIHTNLEFAYEDEGYNILDDFDALNKNHLLDKIIETFKDDYDACQIVLDMMTSDKIKNHETLEKKIISLLGSMPETFDKFQEIFNNIEDKSEVLDLLNSVIDE